jgi:biopolymer transport protein ExbD
MSVMRVSRARSRPRFSVSYMGPLAGVVLGTLALFSPSGRTAWAEPRVQPPTSSGSACLPFRTHCIVTISQSGQLYFSTDNAALQAAVVTQVAGAHGIQLSARQRQQLQQLPYVGLDIRQMPALLALPTWQERTALLKAGIPQPDQSEQLTEYIETTNRLTSAPDAVPALWIIRADRRVSYCQFRQVARLLQQRNTDRIFLGTRIGI